MNNKLTTKRFVIRKSLLGTNTVITFTNKKEVTFTYDHDEIYSTFQQKFEEMQCSNSTNLIQIVILFQNSVEN
jgi:hypothetical protein